MPAEVDSRILTARRVGGTVWTGAQRVDRHNSWGTLADAGATLAVGVCVVIVAMVLQATSVEAMSFSDSLPRGLFTPALTQALATSIARAVPVVSASAGFAYHFDWETGSFIRVPSLLGQLYLETPDPVGRRHLDVSVSYQHVQIDTLQGQDIRNLSDTQAPIFPTHPRGPGFTIPHYSLDLDTNGVTVGFTYGVTNDLELNATVTVLDSAFNTHGAFQGTEATGFRITPLPPTHDSATGVGDLLLRGKYRLLERDWLHLACGLVVRVPTGNPDNFQGTGDVELAPMVYASREPLAVGNLLRFRPYLNAGFDFDASDVNASEARWGMGLDGALGERFTLGVAVLARYPISRLSPPGLFDLRRGKTGKFTLPLFGLSSQRESFYDFSVGGRVNVWRGRVNLFANALLPLNRDGVRADVIPLAGVSKAEFAKLLKSRTDDRLDDLKLLTESMGVVEDAPASKGPRSEASPMPWLAHIGPRAAWADSDADGAIRTLLERYRSALESEDMAQVEALHLALPESMRTALHRYFQNAKELKVKFAKVDILVEGEEALATFTRIDDFLDAESGLPVHLEVRVSSVVTLQDGAWKIKGLKKSS